MADVLEPWLVSSASKFLCQEPHVLQWPRIVQVLNVRSPKETVLMARLLDEATT